jgi:hypothetical protein
VAAEQRFFHFDHCLLGIAAPTIGNADFPGLPLF